MPHETDKDVPPQLINDALDRILASRGFRASSRKQRFLQFIVQETLTGRADRIKGYTIAVDVFDRDANFDPLLDPVVRIQAGRIRHCLEQYYLTDGADDPVRITIPKGSYVPHFALAANRSTALPPPKALYVSSEAKAGDDLPIEERPISDLECQPPPNSDRHASPLKRQWVEALSSHKKAAIPALLFFAASILALIVMAIFWDASPARRDSAPLVSTAVVRGPSLLVLPISNSTGNPAQNAFADSLTEDLIGALIKFRNMRVFGTDNGIPILAASTASNGEKTTTVKPDYVLKGTVELFDNQLRVTVTLMDGKNRRYLWSDAFHRDFTPATLIESRQKISAQVARKIAQPFGVVYEEEARGSAERPPNTLSSYECMLRTYQYWRQLTVTLHAQARMCLERAVQVDPLYAEAWAALALVTVDEGRLGFNRNPARPDPIASGLQLARYSVVLSPDTPLPLKALAMAYWLQGEPHLSIATYERALSLNPNDSDLLAELGRCYSLIGAWDKGVPLILEAYARNPALSNWYHLILALYYYVNGRFSAALDEAKQVNVPESMLPHVSLAMIHAQAGHSVEAAAEVDKILSIDPDFANNVHANLEKLNLAPDTLSRILDGLRKAGLLDRAKPGTGEQW